MGAKTGLLVYADGEVPGLLKGVGEADPERTAALVRRLYPGWEIEEAGGRRCGRGSTRPTAPRTRPAGPEWSWSATSG
ncbi:hypothetical protein GCM10020229_46720 [Kitasatospora albolonga]